MFIRVSRPGFPWARWIVVAAISAATSAHSVAQKDRTTVVTEKRTPLPRALTGSAAVATGDAVFVFGGESASGLSSTVFRLDGRTGEAKVLTDRLIPRRDHKAVLVDDHTVVILGGAGRRAVLADIEIIDLSTGKVRAGAPMPTPRAGLGAAFLNGQILTVGGSLGWGKVNTVELYDLKTDKWFRAPPISVARDGVVVNADGLVYVVGGMSDKGPTDVVERFDGKRFVIAPSLPRAVAGHGAVSSFGKILVLNAVDDPRQLLFFDPVHRDVTSFRTAHAPRKDATVVSLGERLMVLGGSENGKPVDTVEIVSFR